jgi:hypothetical protein
VFGFVCFSCLLPKVCSLLFLHSLASNLRLRRVLLEYLGDRSEWIGWRNRGGGGDVLGSLAAAAAAAAALLAVLWTDYRRRVSAAGNLLPLAAVAAAVLAAVALAAALSLFGLLAAAAAARLSLTSFACIITKPTTINIKIISILILLLIIESIDLSLFSILSSFHPG